MEFILNIKNINWDNILTIMVIWAIPITLVWFSVKLYKFCHPIFLNATSKGKTGKYVRATNPTWRRGLSVNTETDEWLEYTVSATGAPGLPPNRRDLSQ